MSHKNSASLRLCARSLPFYMRHIKPKPLYATYGVTGNFYLATAMQ